MAYYALEVKTADKKITHASYTDDDPVVLVCDPFYKGEYRWPVPGTRVNCPECRQILTNTWRDLLLADDAPDKLFFFTGSSLGAGGVSWVEIIARKRTDSGVMIHFLLCSKAHPAINMVYTLEHLTEMLVDGNPWTLNRYHIDEVEA